MAHEIIRSAATPRALTSSASPQVAPGQGGLRDPLEASGLGSGASAGGVGYREYVEFEEDGIDTVADGDDDIEIVEAGNDGEDIEDFEEVIELGAVNSEPQTAPRTGGRDRYTALAALGTHYRGEHEHASWRPEVTSRSGRVIPQRVQKMDEADRNRNELRADADGLLRRGSGLADSKGAHNGHQARQGEEDLSERLIYAMNGEGRMIAEDAGKRTRERSSGESINYFHHSSFFGGEAVAGAGDLNVDNGWLKTVSNNSGHYKPGKDQMLNTLDALQEMGVNDDMAQVELMKPDSTTKRYHAGPFRASKGDEGLLDRRKAMLEEVRKARPATEE